MSLTSPTYVNDKSFEAYVKYLALKKHFTTDGYDYHKYNGKVRASMDSFRSRNDAFFFAKLAAKDDYVNRILSNMLKKPNIWVRDILESEGDNVYIEWKRKQESLSYTFKSELKLLDLNYQTNFISRDGQHPIIMTMYLRKEISLETFTLLTHYANIFAYWDKILVDKIVSRDIIRMARKYKPFLAIDDKKFKDIVREHFV
jgi:hypothetical protein